MLRKTLTTEELAGTTEGAGIKGRANEGAAGGAAGGTDRARDQWRSVGDVAADLLKNLRRAHGQPLGDAGVKPRRLATLH